MQFTSKERYTMQDLLDIMALLRQPDGCPWDRVQTHESIRRNMIEEAYEVVDTIDRSDAVGMQEELGDVLMQVVFHAHLEEETGTFDFSDVVDGVCKKLVFRHPHVFGTASADDDEKAIVSWEAQKKIEKAQSTQTDSMRSVPRIYPALIRGAKLQEKAARSGVDWPTAEAALDDAEQTLHQIRAALADAAQLQQLFGQLLFEAAGASRLSHIEPEEALAHTGDRFIAQFASAESAAQGHPIEHVTPTDLLSRMR